MNYALMLVLLTAGGAAAQEAPPAATPEERARVEAAVPAKAFVKPAKPRKLLVVNKDVKRGVAVKLHHDSVPLGNLLLELTGKKTGAWEVNVSGDLELWRPDKIGQFDAICFMNTTGVLTEDKELRSSLLRFVREGGGFVAFHAGGPATFVEYPKYDQFPEFGVMVGGYENGGHPWSHRETYQVRVEGRNHPLTRMLPPEFEVKDEVFQMQSPYSREAVRVLISIDTDKADMAPPRRFLLERQADKDFPVSWIKRYGKGRVFYTFLGHNKETYMNAPLAQHFMAGIQYALGDLKADDTPSRFVAGH